MARFSLRRVLRGLQWPDSAAALLEAGAGRLSGSCSGIVMIPSMEEDMDLIGYADRTLLLTPGANRPGNKLTGFDAFVIHGTANPAPRANAVMHYHYWMPGGAGRTVSSVHFVADENVLI